MKAVIIYDDVALAAGRKVEADRTRHLVVDGEEYELDLADATSAQLDEVLAMWLKVARKVVGGRAVPPKGTRRPDGYFKGLRDWADAQDPPRPYRYKVPGRTDYYPHPLQRDYEAWLSDQAASVGRAKGDH